MSDKVTIERTEQWEYTATGYGMEATGSDEESVELNLLRKVVDDLEQQLEFEQPEKDEWISVEDKLPNRHEIVLAFHDNWEIETTHLDKRNELPIGMSEDKATHWMPLPKQPNI